jgi:RsiW-degrading membrane proteinase PrsW (M82 family)
MGLGATVWFLAFQVLLTPVVEEAIKIAPLLLRPAWKMVTSQASALWVGFVLGISFGLGEAGFIAYAVGQNSTYDSLPWYAFTGFLNERIVTCFAHGVFTALLVTGMQLGGKFRIYGYLGAMGLHLFLNTPTVLYQFKWISLEWYSTSMVIPFIVLAAIFERMRRSAREAIDDQMGNEVIYWQHDRTADDSK